MDSGSWRVASRQRRQLAGPYRDQRGTGCCGNGKQHVRSSLRHKGWRKGPRKRRGEEGEKGSMISGLAWMTLRGARRRTDSKVGPKDSGKNCEPDTAAGFRQ